MARRDGEDPIAFTTEILTFWGSAGPDLDGPG